MGVHCLGEGGSRAGGGADRLSRTDLGPWGVPLPDPAATEGGRTLRAGRLREGCFSGTVAALTGSVSEAMMSDDFPGNTCIVAGSNPFFLHAILVFPACGF